MPRAMFCLFVFGLAAFPTHAAASFDTPLKTEVIAIGPKTRLNCLTFPHFLLKWESADYSPTIYILPGKGPWKCAATMKGELTFGSWKNVQVKGSYVVLSEDPNSKWGMPFKVFDTRIWRYVFTDSVIGPFGSVSLERSGMVLEYRRVYRTDCSLFRGTATECWSKLRSHTGIADEAWIVCRIAYHNAIIKARGETYDPREQSASLTYSAVMKLEKGVPTFAARPGPVVCETN